MRLLAVAGNYDELAFTQHGEPPYYWPVDWASRMNRMAYWWFAFVGRSGTGSPLFRTKKTEELGQNSRYIFSLLPFDSLRKSVVAVSSNLQKCAQKFGAYIEISQHTVEYGF